jgi:hypothetical protein
MKKAFFLFLALWFSTVAFAGSTDARLKSDIESLQKQLASYEGLTKTLERDMERWYLASATYQVAIDRALKGVADCAEFQKKL